MKSLKRWFLNIKWLLNHPPTGVLGATEPIVCDFCKLSIYGFISTKFFSICSPCVAKALKRGLA